MFGGIAIKLLDVPDRKLFRDWRARVRRIFSRYERRRSRSANAAEFVWLIRASAIPALFPFRMFGHFGFGRTIRILKSVLKGFAVPCRAPRPSDQRRHLPRRRLRAALRPAAAEHLGDRHGRPRRAVRRGPLLRPRARSCTRRSSRSRSSRASCRSRLSACRRTSCWVVLGHAPARDAFEPYGAPAGRDRPSPTSRGAASRAPTRARPRCWTLPSHVSMFTGLLPRELGLGQAPAAIPAARDPSVGAQSDRHAARPCCAARATRQGPSAPTSGSRRTAASTPASTSSSHVDSPAATEHARARDDAQRIDWMLRAVRGTRRRRRGRSRAVIAAGSRKRRRAVLLVREPRRVPLALPAAAAVQQRRPPAIAPARRRGAALPEPVTAIWRACVTGSRCRRGRAASGCAASTPGRVR